MKLLVQNEVLRMSPTSQESVVRFEIMTKSPTAARVVHQLIENSRENEENQPFWFGGQHAGMPLQHVWAGTTSGEPMDEIQASLAQLQVEKFILDLQGK